MSKRTEAKIRFIFERLGYHPTRKLLKNHFNKAIGRNKEDVISDISQIVLSNPQHKKFIKKNGKQCVQLGARQVELFNVNDVARQNALNKFMASVTISQGTKLSNAYPFPITSQDTLAKIKKNDIEIVDKSSVTIGVDVFEAIVFTTVIEHEVKRDGALFLNQNGIDLVKQKLAEFYYVTKEYRQLFHVLYWNKTDKSAILSIDKNGLSLRKSRDQLYLMRNHIDQLTTGALGKPMNVFDAIEPLYQSNDGKIIRLGHVTSDNNPVRLSLSRGQSCLKQDEYHDAGESGGYVHAKFAVGKRWQFGQVDDTYAVELDLPGKAAMLDTAQPLSDFEIGKCTRLQDFDFVIKHVRPYAC